MRRKIIFGFIILICSVGVSVIAFGGAGSRLASLFFYDDVTSSSVRERYRQGSVSILIVPGHDDENYGTEYGGVREADVTRAIGEYLQSYLAADNKFSATIIRDRSGYAKEFSAYFNKEKTAIGSFMRTARSYFERLTNLNLVQTQSPPVQHVSANIDTQYILYGINKWANENKIDIVLHLHVNDYPRRSWEQEYDGFSIYVPSNQLPNYAVSRELAEHLVSVFSRYWPASNLPVEKDTIIESGQLIATGSNGSLRSGSTLIEYGYIYESRFLVDAVLKEAAFRTYQGMLSFFNEKQVGVDDFSWTLPYSWNENIVAGSRVNPEVVALQAALSKLGLYPPAGKTVRNCPINGNFLSCTESAVRSFQAKYGIQKTGTVGPKTRRKLNELFAERRI